MVGRGGGSIGLGLGVLGSSLVCDIGDISIIAVGRVLDMLDTSIGKSNRVRSGDIAGTIGLLLSVEVGLGVVISDGVGEGVGGNLIGVGLSLVGGGRGVVSGGGVHSVSNDGGGVDSVSNDGGVDGVSEDGGGVHGMSNGGVDSMDGVSHRGVDSVSNHGGVDGVSQGGMDGMSSHDGGGVGDNSRSNMGGEVSGVADNAANRGGDVVSNISGGQAEEGGNDESLKPITF